MFDVVVAVFITICVIELFTFNPNTYNMSYKTTIKNVVSANEKEIVDVITNERLKESVLILKYDDMTLRETKETENKEFMAELHGNTISYKILNNKIEKVSESEDSNPLTFFLVCIIIGTIVFVSLLIYGIFNFKYLIKENYYEKNEQ